MVNKVANMVVNKSTSKYKRTELRLPSILYWLSLKRSPGGWGSLGYSSLNLTRMVWQRRHFLRPSGALKGPICGRTSSLKAKSWGQTPEIPCQMDRPYDLTNWTNKSNKRFVIVKGTERTDSRKIIVLPMPSICVSQQGIHVPLWVPLKGYVAWKHILQRGYIIKKTVWEPLYDMWLKTFATSKHWEDCLKDIPIAVTLSKVTAVWFRGKTEAHLRWFSLNTSP